MDDPFKPKPEHDYSRLSTNERFAAWASDMSARTGGLFIPADVSDPQNQFYQDLDIDHYAWRYSEAEADHDEVRNKVFAIAEKLVPGDGFNRMVEAMQAQPQVLGQILENVRSGRSVAIVTNHPWLMNIGVAEAAAFCALDDPKIGDDMCIIINKMLAWLEVQGQTSDGEVQTMAPYTLLTTFSNVLCSVPRSESSAKFGLDDFGTNYNYKMLQSLLRMSRRGTLLTVAPSGSVDLIDTRETGDLTMKPVSDSTARVFANHFEAAWPITMWMDPITKVMRFDIPSELTSIDSEETIHEIMTEMQKPYESLIRQGDDLGIRAVRYAKAAA